MVAQVSEQKQNQRQKRLLKNLSFLPLVMMCGIAVAAIMYFGNPLMWLSEEQSYAQSSAQDTEKEDFTFLSGLSNGQNDPQSFVVWGEYRSISLDDTASHANNIELAARAIDGQEIKVGQTLSFNELVGDVAADSTYQLVVDYEGYEAKRLNGGGVSQVASALYIAALKSDLEITERHAYLLVQDYVPLGFDAFVAFGEADLKVKNTSNTSLYVRATASGQTVVVKLYGKAKNNGVTVDTMLEISESKTQPLAEILENPKASGEVEVLTINSYRTYTKEGEKLERQHLATDSYLVLK